MKMISRVRASVATYWFLALALIASLPAHSQTVCTRLPGTAMAPATTTCTLVAQEVPWDINKDAGFQAWTYNGSIPGPLLEVVAGDTVIVKVVNKLNVPVSVHPHGVTYTVQNDGSFGSGAYAPPGGEFHIQVENIRSASRDLALPRSRCRWRSDDDRRQLSLWHSARLIWDDRGPASHS